MQLWQVQKYDTTGIQVQQIWKYAQPHLTSEDMEAGSHSEGWDQTVSQKDGQTAQS